jgi:hypothetical protein
MVDPTIGFTKDVIKDPDRFVGRFDLIRQCCHALDSPTGLIAVYGKRGVGKSSLLRQLQQMALGDYKLARLAGLSHEVPTRLRKYLTVYYTCDSTIGDAGGLLSRLCNDQDDEDGLLRLVPDKGKEVIEFSRTKEVGAGADLRVVNWGVKGTETSKYARRVPDDIVQTFRNFTSAVIVQQVKKRMGRDGLLILLDEFDMIRDKSGLGSLIKSISTPQLKFGVCGVGHDLTDLISDHHSVERLIGEGAIKVNPMSLSEAVTVLDRAEELFDGKIKIVRSVKDQVALVSQGYPYVVQLLGRECVRTANKMGVTTIDDTILKSVLSATAMGTAFPDLESMYLRAIGNSKDRQTLLHLMAASRDDDVDVYDDQFERVFLKDVRREAEDLQVKYIDQQLPRLEDARFGAVITRVPDTNGVYEFADPVFRLYVNLRKF